jgi:hypothetical protein
MIICQNGESGWVEGWGISKRKEDWFYKLWSLCFGVYDIAKNSSKHDDEQIRYHCGIQRA